MKRNSTLGLLHQLTGGHSSIWSKESRGIIQTLARARCVVDSFDLLDIKSGLRGSSVRRKVRQEMFFPQSQFSGTSADLLPSFVPVTTDASQSARPEIIGATEAKDACSSVASGGRRDEAAWIGPRSKKARLESLDVGRCESGRMLNPSGFASYRMHACYGRGAYAGRLYRAPSSAAARRILLANHWLIVAPTEEEHLVAHFVAHPVLSLLLPPFDSLLILGPNEKPNPQPRQSWRKPDLTTRPLYELGATHDLLSPARASKVLR